MLFPAMVFAVETLISKSKLTLSMQHSKVLCLTKNKLKTLSYRLE